MKCVGAEDGQKPCQRCKRANVESVPFFHLLLSSISSNRLPDAFLRNTDEDASPAQSLYIPLFFLRILFRSLTNPLPYLILRLSEASKMLRRLEKGLNSAKLKTQATDPATSAPYSPPESRNVARDAIYGAAPSSEPTYAPSSHFPPPDLPPLNVPPQSLPPPATTQPPATAYPTSATSSHTMDIDDEDDPDKGDTPPFPAKLIQQTQRNSFFRIILNTEETPVSTSSSPNRGASYTPPQTNVAPPKPSIPDPISTGLITEGDASVLFDALYLRLNPFINIFDPQLHTHSYVRSRCPFLFTTLIMAGAKFFKPEVFKQCQKMANDLAFRAFQESWKSVEVVQAFACLTYWRDPEDNVSVSCCSRHRKTCDTQV